MTAKKRTGAWSRLAGWAGQGRLIGLILLADLLLLRAWDPSPIESMRLRLFDFFQDQMPRVETAYPVAIVDIDEDSLKAVGQWPWPRSTVAILVNKLRQAKAAAIGFDVVFAEADRNLSIEAGRLLALPPEDLRRALTNLTTNDAILAASLDGSRVVLGEFGLSLEESIPTPPGHLPVTPAFLGGDPRQYLFNYAALRQNIPELTEAAAGRGLISLAPEVDGIVRRVPLVVRVGEVVVPALAVEMLRTATGESGYAIQMAPLWGGVTSGVEAVKVAGVAVPTDSNGRVYVRYAKHDPARFVSAADVIAGRFDAARFAGRLVLIGTSAVGLRDLRATPTETAMPGVEIHAQLLETILAKSFLTRPSYALGMELSVVCIGGIVLIILVPLLGARWALVLHGAATVALFGGSLAAFRYGDFLIDWLFPALSGTAVYLLLVYVKYVRSERQRKEVSQAFRQYLSPVMVDLVARDRDRLRLGGELKTMTVLFADLRGFTAISERFHDDPQGLTTLMNRFLTPMTAAALHHGGTIDKYIGDSLMAFWNAPLDLPDHAARACAAALDLFVALARLNAELAAEGETIELRMGIGINTGECVVGNLGTEHRFNYSVLGDPVNLASRLESLSKVYRVGTVISESTRAMAPGFATLELDLVAVAGKRQAVKAFALLGDAAMAASESFRRLEADHAAMLAAYRAQDWPAAERLIDACEPQAAHLAGLYALYHRRIAHYRANPPATDWDGIFRAEK